MACLDNRWVVIFNHRGFNICTLKVASHDDDFGFRIDSEIFAGKSFSDPADAMLAIDLLGK